VSELPQEISEFLADYSSPIAAQARRLHELVLQAAPTAIARVRHGWRLIGYDLPVGRRTTYFAWVGLEQKHVHVGWQTGTLMADPRRILRGAHLRLKKVRYLTYGPKDKIEARVVLDFTRDAARIAAMSRGERDLLALARSA
jgi:hypothetical protein